MNCGNEDAGTDRDLMTFWLGKPSRSPPMSSFAIEGGPGGFVLQPAPGAAERIPQPGPPTPPVPPPPLAFTLPRELAWSLLFWNEPKPGGKLVLP